MKKNTSKKEYLCEQDRWMAAFAKVNLHEAVDPLYKGKIVEDEELYNKVQQLLDCPDMEHAHQFLLDIDFEDVPPETKQKVDDLYQLAVSQGYIETEADVDDEEDADFADSEEELADDLESEDQPQVTDNSGGFEDGAVPDPSTAAAKDSIGMNAPTLNTCAFTLFYSAMKNGEIRTGECYSNATTLENAKLDAIQKLEKLGFTSIDIIAAEECDPNAKGCDDCKPAEFGAQANDPAPTGEEDVELEQTVSEAEEADNKEKEEPEEKEDEEEKEEPEEEEPEEKELSRSEKIDLFKRYLEEFKGLLQKMKAETYADMALADRAKFYDEMSKIWDGKPDPASFMTPDNVKQIETMKIKLAK